MSDNFKTNPQLYPIREEKFTNPTAMSSYQNYISLESNVVEASKLVDDIILKKYLHKLTDLEIVPLDDSFRKISDIRLFKI